MLRYVGKQPAKLLMRAAHLLKLSLARAVVNHGDLVLAAFLMDLMVLVVGVWTHAVDLRCTLCMIRVVDVT